MPSGSKTASSRIAGLFSAVWGYIWAAGAFLLFLNTVGVKAESPGLSIAIFIVFWWLLTIPHELGHAVVARLLGSKNARIVIGSGPPGASFEFLGFRWLFKKFPVGGGYVMAGSEFGGAKWKNVAMTFGGAAVSLLAALFIWIFEYGAARLPDFDSLLGIFFWANVVLLILSVFPHYYEDGHGRTPNDGMIVLQILFPRSARLTAKRAQRRKEGQARVVRWAGIFLLGVAALGVSALTSLILIGMRRAVVGPWPIVLGCVFAAFTGYLLHRLVREIRSPIELEGPARPDLDEGPLYAGLRELAEQSPILQHKDFAILWKDNVSDHRRHQLFDEGFQRYPKDPWALLQKARVQAGNKSYHVAEAFVDAMVYEDLTDYAKFAVSVCRMDWRMEQENFAGAEEIAEKWLQSDAPAALKANICEYMACLPLYAGQLQFLEGIEKWARKAMEISPDDPDIKASLGSALVEKGAFAEAEPLLIGLTEKAPSVESQAYAMFFVGLMRARQGRRAEAVELLKGATVLSEAEWLALRVEKALKEFGERGEEKS